MHNKPISEFLNYRRGHGLATGRAEPSLINKGFNPTYKKPVMHSEPPAGLRKRYEYPPPDGTREGGEKSQAISSRDRMAINFAEIESHGVESTAHARNIRIIRIPNHKATLCQII